MRSIDLTSLSNKIKARENFILLDVRTVVENQVKSIHGSKHIPLSKLEQHREELLEHDYIITHCAHGFRAEQAAHILSEWGVKKVEYVKGDIENWEASGLPIVTHV